MKTATCDAFVLSGDFVTGALVVVLNLGNKYHEYRFVKRLEGRPSAGRSLRL